MKRKLRIGILAPPWNEIPPTNYGGTELIVDLTARGFAARGHEPVLFTTAKSSCPVTKIATMPEGNMPPDKYQEHLHIAAMIDQAKELDLDIIHSHLEGILPYADLLPCPVVCTLHVEITEQRSKFLKQCDKGHLVSISHNHASTIPRAARVIYNGIDLDRFPYREEKEDYLFFVGAITREKGVDIAAKAATELAQPLKIAGYLHKDSELWFEEEVLSLGSGGEIEYLGMISHEEKLHHLSHAKSVLCPIRWEEPFGLVPVEAMACGTPVIANRRGALAELIEPGTSGFLCDSEGSFLDCLSNVGELTPADCRQRVAEHFNSELMVDRYLDYFHEVLGE